ncbi:hypothetical protein OG271_25560 [Micromonospora rifamycinica]|uniref:hypothetical protein n=1 Tax=Micromonospora rifamycinica TaxID=291594 RepID=UPI002E294BA5|nr:hypothetical protein [Micromonospora rifamycinica]
MPMDEPITPALVRWTAQRVLAQHHEAPDEPRPLRRCFQCDDDGCHMLAWARDVLRAHRQPPPLPH